MNVFFLLAPPSGSSLWELVTPVLDGMILPGVTRQSVLDLARDYLSFEQPKWRFTTNAVYSNGPLRAFVQGRWIDKRGLNRLFNTGLTNAATIEDNTVSSVFYTDLNLSYEHPMDGKKLKFFANVTNLLDRAPPQTPGTVGTGGTGQPSLQYDTIGRTYTLGVNLAF
jgi:hypothetical protein